MRDQVKIEISKKSNTEQHRESESMSLISSVPGQDLNLSGLSLM